MARRLSGQLHEGSGQLDSSKSTVDRLNVTSSAQTLPPIFQTVSTRQNLLTLLLALTLCHDLLNVCLTGVFLGFFFSRDALLPLRVAVLQSMYNWGTFYNQGYHMTSLLKFWAAQVDCTRSIAL